MPEYIPQKDDIPLTATSVVLGGSCGQIVQTQSMVVNIQVVALPNSRRKQPITHGVAFRVWKLHKRMNHVPLHTIAHMSLLNILGDAEATYQEINLEAAHQDCYACALAK